jgi:lycopene cyclase domain-containing protein
MGLLYLIALLIALTGMVVLDRRFRLFFWQAPVRAAIVLVVGVLFFVVWDVAGIGLGIFFRGETSFMTGVLVAPELPLEELFFLTLLCYLTMNLFGAAQRWSRGRAARGEARRGDSGSSGREASSVSRPSDDPSRRDQSRGGQSSPGQSSRGQSSRGNGSTARPAGAAR